MPRLVFGTLALSVLLGVSPQASPSRDLEPHFAPYTAAHGHARPVVAVIGHNEGTELTDFVIPYSVLQRSGAVETFAVATKPGAMRMRPAMRLRPDADIAGFDRRFPEGADYVIVPAIVRSKDPALLDWIRAQHAKGATIVSICDGALVVANTGLLKGHRATAHWATEGHRRDAYPDTDWIANTRYVIDGRMASSAGISASIPASLALLESIAGRERAAAVGAQFGVETWTTRHNSDAFHLRTGNLGPFVKVAATNKWFHREERLGIPLVAGIDDVSLALTADAFTRTGRAVAYGVANADVRGRSGLAWVPDTSDAPDAKHALAPIPAARDVPLFDAVLAAIDGRYGRTTAKGVALDFEYPWVPATR